jgi:hypothetical protein
VSIIHSVVKRCEPASAVPIKMILSAELGEEIVHYHRIAILAGLVQNSVLVGRAI